MTTEQDEREARLPRWARNELEWLRANLASRDRAEREASTGETDTWRGLYTGAPLLGLPLGEVIRFVLGPGDPDDPGTPRIDARVLPWGDRSVLDLSAGTALYFRPMASNHGHVLDWSER